LSNELEYLKFASNPREIFERLEPIPSGSIFIDEIQRIPSLLNNVQVILDNPKNKLRFYLTGSSARKLKRGQANLLPGRVIGLEMGPLVASELKYKMDIDRALSFGSLPGIYLNNSDLECELLLQTYGATYLKEEVQAEGLTRNMEGFARFLAVAAEYATEFLDLSKFGSQAMIDRQSAARYFEILEDTLIVHRADSFAKSGRRRLIQHPRYFVFDNGVLNGLLGSFAVTPDRKGRLFENFLFSQLLFSAKSSAKPIRISSYRTEHGAEVDYIVEYKDTVWAIEAKASSIVGAHDLNGLKSFATFYNKSHQARVAYLGDEPRTFNGIDIIPWQHLLMEMGL
jgi:predicted AAA+ superfamily ATPase